jgi:hypothetical protein
VVVVGLGVAAAVGAGASVGATVGVGLDVGGADGNAETAAATGPDAAAGVVPPQAVSRLAATSRPATAAAMRTCLARVRGVSLPEAIDDRTGRQCAVRLGRHVRVPAGRLTDVAAISYRGALTC